MHNKASTCGTDDFVFFSQTNKKYKWYLHV